MKFKEFIRPSKNIWGWFLSVIVIFNYVQFFILKEFGPFFYNHTWNNGNPPCYLVSSWDILDAFSHTAYTGGGWFRWPTTWAFITSLIFWTIFWYFMACAMNIYANWRAHRSQRKIISPWAVLVFVIMAIVIWHSLCRIVRVVEFLQFGRPL